MKVKEMLEKVDEGKTDKYEILEEFINKNGIKKLRTKDLDQIIDKYGFEIFTLVGFDFTKVYDIVSTRESSTVMNRFTLLIFIFTIITTVCTVITTVNL